MPANLVDSETLEQLLAPLVAEAGLELVVARHLLEPGGKVLRVLIEHPAPAAGGERRGVSLDDCSRVTRIVSAALDEQERLFQGAYRLEVSSPGLDRPLVRESDYQRFVGSEARITLRGAGRERKKYVGTLAGFADGQVLLLLREKAGEEARIAFSDIAKAHLVHRF